MHFLVNLGQFLGGDQRVNLGDILGGIRPQRPPPPQNRPPPQRQPNNPLQGLIEGGLNILEQSGVQVRRPSAGES